jgi:3-dehydrosphinganine reductase
MMRLRLLLLFSTTGITMHICFPCTIFSPDLLEENKVKPTITLKLEESQRRRIC